MDVFLQVAAARAALDGLGKVLLKRHFEYCVTDAFKSGRLQDRKQKFAELMDVFSRFSKIGGR